MNSSFTRFNLSPGSPGVLFSIVRLRVFLCTLCALSWLTTGLVAQSSFRRGDSNGDSRTNVNDAISVLGYLF